MNKIDEHIINEYLTCGQTYDNYIFCNCPSFVVDFAKNNLQIQTNKVIPITTTLINKVTILVIYLDLYKVLLLIGKV